MMQIQVKQSCLKLSTAGEERERRWWAVSKYHIHRRTFLTVNKHTPCGVCQASPDTESGREFFPWYLKRVCLEYLFCKVGRTQPPSTPTHHLMLTQGCPLSASKRPRRGVAISTQRGKVGQNELPQTSGLPGGLCSWVTSLLALTNVHLLSYTWLSEKPHGDIKLCAAFATAFE